MIKDTSSQDSARTVNRPLKKSILMLMLLLLGLIGAAVAYPTIQRWNNSDLTLDASRLRFAMVERGEFIRDVSVQGQIVAAVRPMLFSPEDGRVTTFVRSGDRVTKGDLLAEIESPELHNEYQREQSSLQTLETELARQAIETRMEELKHKEAVTLSEMELIAAKRERRRAELAHEHQAIALQDYEKALDDENKALAIFSHQRDEYSLKSERLKLELDILNQSLNRQKLIVQDLQRKVLALKIVSPVDGVVGNLEVDQKAIIAKYQPVLSVVDMSAYEVETSVPESYADELAQGMSAQIDFSGQKFTGELSAISPEIENGQVRCRIRFTGEKPTALRQNQRVTSRILLENRPDILMVARGPFMQSGSRGYVYVVENNVAVKTNMQAGMTSVGRVEILSGLKEGDEIVISSSDVFEDHNRVLLLNQ